LADDDVTRRQLLAAMLAGAAPAAADDSDEPDADAAPVPTAPGTPYQPLVNRPAPKGYSPPYGPPPWSGSPNPMAVALAGGNGPPAGAAPAAGSPTTSPAPSAPPNRGFLASLLAGITPESPTTGSRYNPQTGEFLPEGANAQPSAAPQLASAAAAPGGAQNIAGKVRDIGEDSTMSGYRTEHDAAITQLNAALAKGDAAAAAGNYEAAKIYFNAAQESAKRADAVQDKAIEYAKPPKEVAEGAHVYNPAKGGYEVPVPAEDKTNAPTEEQAAEITSMGGNPKDYLFNSGKPELIPQRPPNTDLVRLPDGTSQLINKATGELIGAPIGKQNEEGKFTPGAIDELAERARQGDQSAMTGLGYGKMGSANRAAVANRTAEIMMERGEDPTAIVRNIVGLSGEKAGARTMGQLGARINTFAEEAKQTGSMALQASDAMPRGRWVPITQIEQMGEAAASDPNLSRFQAANNAFANTYAKAVNPSGVPTDEGRRKAFELLNVAKSPEAYRATIEQLQREMSVVQNAISTSRGSQLYGGEATPSVPGVPPAAPTAPKRHGVYVPGKGIQFQ
jgi:hypothetical protein